MKTPDSDASLIGGLADGVPRRQHGRPREFDLDHALDAAVQVFWKKGYEGTSMPDLTEAMGINRPSLYAAFGNKECLFRKVVDRYLESAGKLVGGALAEPKIRDAMLKLMTIPCLQSKSGRAHGCLLINAALACGDESEAIRRDLADRRHQTELAVRRRLAQAVVDRELLPSTNLDALAKFIATFNNGLAVQRTGGATAEELSAAVGVAMQAIDAALVEGRPKKIRVLRKTENANRVI